MIYTSIDIETTGLDPKICDILEFAAVLEDTTALGIPIDRLPTYHAYVKLPTYTGEPFALSMHADKFKTIADEKTHCVNYNTLLFHFSEWLRTHRHPYDKEQNRYVVTAAGKNAAGFDLPFLREKLSCGWKFVKFRHRVIDPAVLYVTPEDSAPPGLTQCLERAGLPTDGLHSALWDARAVIQLLRHKRFGQ